MVKPGRSSMSKMEAKKKVVEQVVQTKKRTDVDVKNENDRVIRESRAQYRSFIESINRSSDRDIERALSGV